MVERFLCIKNSMHELDSLTCLYKTLFAQRSKRSKDTKLKISELRIWISVFLRL